MIPAQSTQGPPVVGFDKSPQRVAGIACLSHGIDLVVGPTAALQPRVAVVPDLSTFDFEADDSGAFDRDDEVNFMIFEVIGDSLTSYKQVLWLKLVNERSVDLALRLVGKTRIPCVRNQSSFVDTGKQPLRCCGS